MQGTQVQSLVEELRSHMLQGKQARVPHSKAWMPQLEKPVHPNSWACNKKSLPATLKAHKEKRKKHLGFTCSFSRASVWATLGFEHLLSLFWVSSQRHRWQMGGFSTAPRSLGSISPWEAGAEEPLSELNLWARKSQSPSNWQYHSMWRISDMAFRTMKLPTVRKNGTPPLWYNQSSSNRLIIISQIICNNIRLHLKMSFITIPKPFFENSYFISAFMPIRNRNLPGLLNAIKKGEEGHNLWGKLRSSLSNYPVPFSNIKAMDNERR